MYCVTLWRIKCAASIHAAPWRGDGVHERGAAGTHAGPDARPARGRVGAQCRDRHASDTAAATTTNFDYDYCKSRV